MTESINHSITPERLRLIREDAERGYGVGAKGTLSLLAALDAEQRLRAAAEADADRLSFYATGLRHAHYRAMGTEVVPEPVKDNPLHLHAAAVALRRQEATE